MAIYPGAKKRLIDKWNKVAMTRYRRMNLHVAVYDGASLYSMFSNSNAACSHFYVAKDGTVEQYIDTKYRSASDYHGNDSTISVETQGGVHNPNGEKWTPEQVEALHKLWKWAQETHGIKNQIAKNTQTNENSSGLSWHRLGVDGNFKGRGGILEVSYKPGGILYSKARGKECPGDAKILQVEDVFKGTKAPSKPAKPAPSKPKPDTKPKPSKGKGWPAEPLPITSKHTAESDKAWRELLAALKVNGKYPYRDENLTTNIERWLKDLGYYKGIIEKDHGKVPVFGRMLVEALQRFLASKKLYTRAIDGNRQGHTVQAEIKYLNLPANRGVK